MKEQIIGDLMVLFLVFCRVGACTMLLPGISGERIAPSLRLMFAVSLSMCLAPLVGKGVAPAVGSEIFGHIASELLIGAYLGLLVRIFYLALEFSAVAMANYAGYASAFSQAILDNQATGPFSQFITLTCVALFFIADLHLAVIEMLRTSYAVVVYGSLGDIISSAGLQSALKQSFALTLQLSAPLLIYSLLLNLGFGILNRLVPQVPVYIVSVPFVTAGALVIMLHTEQELSGIFIAAVATWIGKLL